MTSPTFYTVSTARYFPGTVALLNSLRLTGNTGELVVLDVDLSSQQKAHLDPHCTLVEVPRRVAVNPLLLKPFPASLGASGIVVIIDSDIIVTGDLSRVLAEAEAGKICVYPDSQSDRWFAEWEQLFELAAPLRRQGYVNSGFVAFSSASWPELLRRWQRMSETIPSARTRAGGAARETPLWDGDQDALNAILMSEVPADALAMLPAAEAPASMRDRHRVRVLDTHGLACSVGDLPTVFVHSAGTPKPWQDDGWQRKLWADGYVRLLPRVLFEHDVCVRLRARDLPLWLRPGYRGRLIARVLDVGHFAFRTTPQQIRRSIAVRPRRPAG
jgi:hypothetical protein